MPCGWSWEKVASHMHERSFAHFSDNKRDTHGLALHAQNTHYWKHTIFSRKGHWRSNHVTCNLRTARGLIQHQFLYILTPMGNQLTVDLLQKSKNIFQSLCSSKKTKKDMQTNLNWSCSNVWIIWLVHLFYSSSASHTYKSQYA